MLNIYFADDPPAPRPFDTTRLRNLVTTVLNNYIPVKHLSSPGLIPLVRIQKRLGIAKSKPDALRIIKEHFNVYSSDYRILHFLELAHLDCGWYNVDLALTYLLSAHIIRRKDNPDVFIDPYIPTRN